MAQIVIFANQKGGVAKTTTTHNIGVSLAQMDKKILLVDLDPQANLTIGTGLEPEELKHTIVDVFEDEHFPISDCIVKLKPNLHILPSIIDLATLEMQIISRTSREKILDRILTPVKNNYDFILIDCPPQLNMLAINAFSCADKVLIPVQTDYYAYRALSMLMNSIDETRELTNNKIKIIGVIATLYDMRANDDKEILSM